MFNSVEFVREVCKSKGVSIAKLEKDCGFSNGYLNPKKMAKISYDRAVVIAEYLGISVDSILTGKKEQPTETDGLSERKRLFIEKVKQMSNEELDRIEKILAVVESTK
jgi:transcriptional regulator with XRE-family HTH domain